MRGRTLGILGFGSIGQSLARKATALGMRVLALSRPGQPIADVPGVECVDHLAQLFAGSDHLVAAAPLTPTTRGMAGPLQRDATCVPTRMWPWRCWTRPMWPWSTAARLD